jgi:hypothetical protein
MLETLLRRLDMVRLTIGAAAMVLVMGCSGLIDDGDRTVSRDQSAMFLTGARLHQLLGHHNGSRTATSDLEALRYRNPRWWLRAVVSTSMPSSRG